MPNRNLVAAVMFANLTLAALSCRPQERDVIVHNRTGRAVSGLRVRHGAQMTGEFALAPDAWNTLRMKWDTDNPYEVLLDATPQVVVGQCRVEHLWVRTLSVVLKSLDPPVLLCAAGGGA
jgi:hypothetical protein